LEKEKIEFGLQNQYDPVKFYVEQKKKLFKAQKFGLQNQYGCVIYPSIRNFIWSKKKHTFEGKKTEKHTVSDLKKLKINSTH
jgi:hypothetical protein